MFLDETLSELAHATRVTMLGQLTASIAHEVNQPLAAIVNYAKSGKRWLAREVPDVAEIAHSLDHIVSNGTRAAEIISRIRALVRKTAAAYETARSSVHANVPHGALPATTETKYALNTAVSTTVV